MTTRINILSATFDMVLVRVVYQLIVLDYRKHPERYAPSPGGAILDLSYRLRDEGWVNLYWTAQSAARWSLRNITMNTWRDELQFADRERAIHKRLPRGYGPRTRTRKRKGEV